MNAGMLNKRITIQAETMTYNSFNEQVKSYTDLATVWANIKAVSGREFFLAQQVNSKTEFIITIRYRRDVNTTRRIKYLDTVARYFNIDAVLDKDMSRKYLQLMCSEVK